MIELQGLGKRYGSFSAVEGLDLTVAPGQVFGFLGPNGAGKTTSIRMICGLLKPSQGRVLVDGLDMALEPSRAKACLGYVPDKPELFPQLSPREILQLSAGLHGLEPEAAMARGLELLKAFGLEAWADERCGGFSHGMKQKLSLCCALLHAPKVLVLDEPMVGLDPRGGRQVKDLLRRLAASGHTVFLSIHTLEIAEKLCDRLAILAAGRLLAQGSLEEVKALAGSAHGNLEEVFLKLTGEEGGEAIPDSLLPPPR